MEKVIEIPHTIYQGGEGSFGVINKNGYPDWYRCREHFQEDHPRTGQILFSAIFHNQNRQKNVIAFINKVEDILKLSKYQRIKFHKTNKDGILCCELGSFWRIKPRRQLVTILLRSGRSYRGGDFWDFALRQDYLSRTVAAFRSFMKGNTNYYGSWYGWVETFTNSTAYKKLTKKRRK